LEVDSTLVQLSNGQTQVLRPEGRKYRHGVCINLYRPKLSDGIRGQLLGSLCQPLSFLLWAGQKQLIATGSTS